MRRLTTIRQVLRGGAAATLALAALLAPAAATAAPSPETGFATPVGPPSPCASKTYSECRRLHFAYGPIVVTPGANYQLVGPVTIQKPAYDGYMTSIKADLVRSDGKPPPVDVVHLHHGVWISEPQYGNNLPFFGVGEEKTVAEERPGYGTLVRGTDVWLLNYMLHNQTTAPETVWITYDVDYVPRQAAEKQGIKPVVPLWIDVRYGEHPFYPVFNVDRRFGKPNAITGKRECTYPRDRCADSDPFGDPQPGNGKGYDWTVPARFAGTLVGMGGHVHPGGLRDEVSLVRNVGGRERVRPIFTSEAVYYDKRGPVSWDMSMTTTKPTWSVKVKPGDRIRLNAVYDADTASWYEGMGIVVASVAPGDQGGVDPFEKVPVRRRGAGKTGVVMRYPKIDLKGQVTHGHLAENDNHGGENVTPLPSRGGRLASEVNIANFSYSPGDLSQASARGLPLVKSDRPVTFNNYDATLGIWHTITACKAPCDGRTGISYPIADAAQAVDSLELGWAPPEGVQPTGGSSNWSLEPRQLGLKPGETYTYFCRVHPFMRGGFRVVE